MTEKRGSKKDMVPRSDPEVCFSVHGYIATEHGWQHASTEHCYKACVIEVI
jgi:hypothetical protein